MASSMNTMDNKYRYQPLSSARATRLIMLQEAKEEQAPLACSIVETTLEEPAEYYALSYTWGGEIPSVPMSVSSDADTACDASSGVLLLTPNCAAALVLLRKSMGGTTTGMWVDAVCIDQTSIEEKNVQVAIMYDIYSCAKCVIVWLGEDWAPKTSKNVELLSYQAVEIIHRSRWHLSDGIIRSIIRQLAVRLFLRAAAIVCDYNKTLSRLAQSPYWTRAWTLQEIAHKKVKMLCRNSYACHMEAVFGALDICELAQDNKLRSPGLLFHQHFLEMAQTGVCRGIQTLECVDITRLISMQASDPRDKIYALRSQLPGAVGGMDVNYNQPVESVFIAASRHIIMQEHTEEHTVLAVLSNASRPKRLHGLPSWVVDWTSEDIADRFWSDYSLRFRCRAFRTSQTRYNFSEDGKRLCLQGTLVDRVHDRHISSASPLFSSFSSSCMRYSFRSNFDPVAARVVFEETIAWFSELTAAAKAAPGTVESALEVPEDALSSVARLLELIAPNALSQSSMCSTPETDLTKMVSDIASHRRDRELACVSLGTGRLFLTTEGSFGCGLSSIEPGDLLCIFSGLPYPFAVRPSGSSYILVGPVLLDGVMEGEMWPEDESVLEEWEFV